MRLNFGVAILTSPDGNHFIFLSRLDGEFGFYLLHGTVCIPDVPSRMGGIARYTLLGEVFLGKFSGL